ncbi:MAG: sulfotransferase domain-containing protein [Bacteroidia bacterium]|nr:sulfotransferase domain-containing protein [Bacteroidia bacterium]
MSAFRNPPLFSSHLPTLLLLRLARMTGLAKRMVQWKIKTLASDQARRKVYAGYQPAAHDIFALVYSKSGTNWILQIIQQAIWLGESEFDHIHSVVPWAESPFPGIPPLNENPPRLSPHTGLRCIKANSYPTIVPWSEKARYVGVIRDPKEILVSSYHFFPANFGLTGHYGVQEWVDLFQSNEFFAGSWARHTAELWAMRDRPNVLILQFHEMKKDLPAAVRKVVDFLGLSLTEAQIQQVIAKSGYKYMESIDEKFGPPILPLVGKAPPKMMRKGASGGSGELLSPAQQQSIDDWARSELTRLGSDFPYQF